MNTYPLSGLYNLIIIPLLLFLQYFLEIEKEPYGSFSRHKISACAP